MEKNVSVSVINLDRRPDRMEYMAAALDRLGLPYTRIPAVDARDPANDWLIDGVPARITGIRMRRGEHATHASHCAAWEDARVRGLDAVVVLEDDAVISDDFADLMTLDWIPEDADLVKLEAYWGEIELGPVAGKPFPERTLHRLHSVHLGTAGTLITASGLKKLEQLMAPETISDPVDRAIFDKHSPVSKALTIYQIVPAMVRQAEFFSTPDTSRVRTSDLAAGRDAETNNGAAYGNPHSLGRRARRMALRVRARLKGRRRTVVPYR